MARERQTGTLEETPLSDAEKKKRIPEILRELKGILRDIPELPEPLRQVCFGETEVLSGGIQNISVNTTFRRGMYNWELKYERDKYFADSRLLQKSEMLEISQQKSTTVLRGVEIRTGTGTDSGYVNLRTSQIRKNMNNGYIIKQNSVEALEKVEKITAILGKTT